MSMMGTREYIQVKKDELSFLVRVLEEVYGDKEKLSQALKKGAVLGDDISGLKKHPAKVMEVFLPIICSYSKERTGLVVLHNGEYAYFKDAIDALLNYGVDEFYQELQKVR